MGLNGGEFDTKMIYSVVMVKVGVKTVKNELSV